MGQAFGIIGLEVMGRNIALNIERNGFPIAVYNRTWAKTEHFLKELAKGKNAKGGKTIAEFVQMLDRPRRILIMVKAGAPVDAVLAELKPHLQEGDIVIDGGNSLFTDTQRRSKELEGTGIKFFGMGVSGGEEGALWGPSIMPGGDPEAYQHLKPILTKIAAKAPDDGYPCADYMGRGGAGHFVKMVHNGIEYGDMQLIAEAYSLLKSVGGLDNAQLKEVFDTWNGGDDLRSFLIEITAKVINYQDLSTNGKPLVELILDKAGAKGTGKWTSQTALDLGVAIPTITAAVDARSISSLKDQRVRAAKELSGPSPSNIEEQTSNLVEDVRSALYCSKICSYAQGFAMLAAADKEYGFGLKMGEIARVWKAGCIIRAVFLNDITQSFNEQPDLPNLLLAPRFRDAVSQRQAAWRRIVSLGVAQGIPLPAFSASLAYFDSYRSERLPANLIQAQRDFFGAHTYERTDKPGSFHTEWTAAQPGHQPPGHEPVEPGNVV
ncbi:MAG TPA: NADP-dependent phosphogluconate dehydrogenase [Tepidisphaeraceae bacterium]|nr:NADP-dependent phosphogluconate dehydrogenase [Tepidisphaeraceae bacterium]